VQIRPQPCAAQTEALLQLMVSCLRTPTVHRSAQRKYHGKEQRSPALGQPRLWGSSWKMYKPHI